MLRHKPRHSAMTRVETAMFVVLAAVLAAAIVGAANIPRINAWEKANAYPYGKLCDVFRSCPVVTR